MTTGLYINGEKIKSGILSWYDIGQFTLETGKFTLENGDELNMRESMDEETGVPYVEIYEISTPYFQIVNDNGDLRDVQDDIWDDEVLDEVRKLLCYE